MPRVGILRRVRSYSGSKRDPALDSVQDLLDTIEGRNNPPLRDLPPMDLKQTMQTMVLLTSKEPCYLCQGTPHCVRAYCVPQGLNALGQKLILYTLCFSCEADVASRSKIEYRLVKQLQTENAVAN